MSKTTKKSFDGLDKVAGYLRKQLKDKKYILLFAHNGIGKTRLSMEFKKQGRKGNQRDTLYFNAYTEDLFAWDNDLDNDKEYKLKLNTESKFFDRFEELEMDNRIRPLLNRYTDFDFKIDTNEWVVRFFRDKSENIKVSRGEENIFIWCFFLAIVELAIDNNIDSNIDNNIKAYDWVKYIYIDDPISSLDENNAIMVGSHLAKLLKKEKHSLKTVISSHHTLFFNVMWNELIREKEKEKKNFFAYFMDIQGNKYTLKNTGNTPFSSNVVSLKKLHEAEKSGKLYTYHFNILRSILEKIAIFHGFTHFSDCIKKEKDDPYGVPYSRIINILNHGNYSLFEPQEMVQDNKDIFYSTLDELKKNYRFNLELFEESTKEKPV